MDSKAKLAKFYKEHDEMFKKRQKMIYESFNSDESEEFPGSDRLELGDTEDDEENTLYQMSDSDLIA